MSTHRSNKRSRLATLSSSPSSATTAVVNAEQLTPQSALGSLNPTPWLEHQHQYQQQDPMAFFSEEIALHIFEVLEPSDLGKCAGVSRLWHRLVNDQMLWRRLFLKYQFIFPRGLGALGTRARLQMSSRSATPSRQHLKRKRSSQRIDPQYQEQEQHLQQSHQQPPPPPQQQQQHVEQERIRILYQHQCWKALYRLNYNWIMGQARVTSVSAEELVRRDQDAFSGLMQSYPGGSGAHTPIVRFKGSVILVVSPSNLVHLWRIKSVTETAIDSDTATVASSRFAEPQFWQTYRSWSAREESSSSRITCLSLDDSTRKEERREVDQDGWQRVMVGYDSGHFSIFEYAVEQRDENMNCREGQDMSSSEKEAAVLESVETLRRIGNTTDLAAWSEVGQIQAASFRYAILTTYSDDGAISIYLIQAQPTTTATEPASTTAATETPLRWCRLLHRLYGTSTGSPVGIALDRVKSNRDEKAQWRALVSFGLELYDGSWTVRLQEIEFDEHSILHSTEIGTEGDELTAHHSGGSMDMDEGYDSPYPAYFQATSEASECASSPTSGSGSSATTTGHARIGTISAISISWPFVVTTHSDNTMNVFQMARDPIEGGGDTGGLGHQQRGYSPWYSSSTSTLRNERLRFQHLSTLYGHCGAVSSVSIESRSGRLVSASMDRSIKVWTMAGTSRTTERDRKDEEEGYDRLEQQRVHRCAVSMSDINKSWTEGGQVTKEEGLGLVWVGSDEEKIVSINCDGTVKVWQFS